MSNEENDDENTLKEKARIKELGLDKMSSDSFGRLMEHRKPRDKKNSAKDTLLF